MAAAMFRITQNTAHCFSLVEILLMVALNQVEAKAKLDQVASVSVMLIDPKKPLSAKKSIEGRRG
jgi:hypothetical protein